MVVVGAGAGAGLGPGIGGTLILIRRRRLPRVHPSVELAIIPMISTTIKKDVNFAIITLKQKANTKYSIIKSIAKRALESPYVRQAKI